MYYTYFQTKSISDCMLSLVSFLNKYKLRQHWVQTACNPRTIFHVVGDNVPVSCGHCILWEILEHGESAGVGSQRGSGILSYKA